MVEPAVVDRLVQEFRGNPDGIRAAVALLEEGAAIPFLARYRRERTGGLDEATIRALELRVRDLREIERRRASILRNLKDPDPTLVEAVTKEWDRARLEDLFAPHRPGGRGKGSAARGRGLEALAARLRDPAAAAEPAETLAAPFVDAAKGVSSAAEALEGAAAILVDAVSDDPFARGCVRDEMRERGTLVAVGFDEKKEGAAKYRDYAHHREPLRHLAPHRFLALRRAERDRILAIAIEIDAPKVLGLLEARVAPPGASDSVREVIRRAIREALDESLIPRCAADVRLEAKERADEEAIAVFARNLRHLLLSPPFGRRPVLGIEAATKGAWRAAVVDAFGKCVADAAVRVAEPEKRAEALGTIAGLLSTHAVEAIAVGSGTGAGEVLRFAREAARAAGRSIAVALVNDAGVAVHAASASAREELPNLDQNLRAAVILARRLQDPLAEYLKVEPRAIGVGEYQQDVNRLRLDHALEATIVSCVNFVGVDPNTADAALLSRIAGIGSPLAEAIVAHRTAEGAFRRKTDLLRVPGFDARAFEQAAGFLRLRTGEDPLDATGVHPEHADLAKRMAEKAGKPVAELIGNRAAVDALDPAGFADAGVSEAAIRDVLHELGLAGRDPRASFRAVAFRDDVNSIDDLKEGMTLEGIVSNVTNFGAFVDLGLSHDGLVHVSEMAGRFVRDPQEVVRVGEVVKVRVVGIDRARGRIGLSMKPPPPPKRERAPEPAAPAVPRRDRTPAPASAASGPPPARPPREKAPRVAKGPPPLVRAASHRRDGLGKGGRGGRDDRKGGGGGRPGHGPGRGRGRGREDGSRADEGFEKDAGSGRATPRPSRPFTNNPFRAFFAIGAPDEETASARADEAGGATSARAMAGAAATGAPADGARDGAVAPGEAPPAEPAGAPSD